MTTSSSALSAGALCCLFADRIGTPLRAKQRYAGLIVPSSGARIWGFNLVPRAWEVTYQHLIENGALVAQPERRRRLLVTRETLGVSRLGPVPKECVGLDRVALESESPSVYKTIFDWVGFLGEPEGHTLSVLHEEVERAGLGRPLQSKLGGWLHPDFMEWDREAIAAHEPAFQALEESWGRFEADHPETARLVGKDVRLAITNRSAE